MLADPKNIHLLFNIECKYVTHGPKKRKIKED